MWGAIALRAAAAKSNLIDVLIAPGSRTKIAALISAPLAGRSGPLLDVGCGPRPRIAWPEQIGIDIDRSAVASYRRFAAAVEGDSAELPFANGQFNMVMSVGLLHHLNPDLAARSLREMLRVISVGGLVIVFDGIQCSRPWRTPVAAAIRSLDRGAHMRSSSELSKLLDAVGWWEISRMHYTWTGLEGLIAIHKKT